MHRQRQLGNTGKQVTVIGLGAMPLSLDTRPDETTAIEVITAFIEGGGNFIDTANVYCIDDNDVGHNEHLIHKALAKLGKLDDIIVATKGGLRRPKGGWDTDASPKWLRASCEKSLKDLNAECIFLYQLHAPDPNVPLMESVGELARLKLEGKIKHIGLSNVNTREIRVALSVTQILSVQNRCNVLEKKSFKNGVVELCAREGIVFIPHSPVGGHFDHVKLATNKNIKKIADKHGVSVYQIALAWLLHKGEHILPIPGASKVSSITDSLKAVNVELDQDDLYMLDQL
ncbi:MAG: aldo/keto reductase [Gammaproteobacteria bacterium]|nr:aldo/keto reductase [Gammaproteobacteria bacterium]